jgi:hypothetical protein
MGRALKVPRLFEKVSRLFETVVAMTFGWLQNARDSKEQGEVRVLVQQGRSLCRGCEAS